MDKKSNGIPATTFKEYLTIGVNRKAFRDPPEMDFARDVLRDSKFKDFREWEKLETYLIFYRACDEAIYVAKKLFKKWKASQ
jgi:hypothetical protein